MDSSIFLTFDVAAAIVFFFFFIFLMFRNFRSRQENIQVVSPSTSVSPSSVSSSSSSSHTWIHDVFPSFRGEDVRRNFLSHVQNAFKRKAITLFNDNGIKRGESIGPELIRAIRGSKIAIILISTKYASSKWCLDELVEIMKCRKELGQTVMVIFHKVDPSDVKKFAGDFGKLFRKTCKGQTKVDKERWSQALKEVATIAGYHSINWDNEAVLIENIAKDVSEVLKNSAPSSDFNNLVGMGAHMERMDLILRQDSDEVRMIGIWGPSGIGKSTLARVLFSKYSQEFQLSVFMDNIKRRFPRQCHDKYSAQLQLQQNFLSQTTNDKDIIIPNLGVAQDRLKDKRVFVVLDDVDHSMQLEAVAKEPRWFGPGSRIIITTQDKKVLYAHGVNHIYEVGFPSYDEALEIFCMNVFGQKSPYDGFEDLAKEVTLHVGELPLGLEVMGSHFKGLTKQDWKNELVRLKANLNGDIKSVLKFSYDALCDEDKTLFLYLACFFNYQEKEIVEGHLAKNFSSVQRGLRVLDEKSLISIRGWGTVYMHNLLQCLGRDIVRKQSILDRQFFVGGGDICKVLTDTTSFIGIEFKCSEIKEELNTSVFGTMRNLQFLRVRGNSQHALQQTLNDLPQKISLLHWEYFPGKCLPSNFDPTFLVELYMPDSKLEKLWEGIKTIKNLKRMDLHYSNELMELPDFSTAINLEKLDLYSCSHLVEIPSSIENAVKLTNLDFSGCSSLVELPLSITKLTTLQELNVMGCSSLLKLPQFPNSLDFIYCAFGRFFPRNIKFSRKLDLSGCSSLVELPSSIGNISHLGYLNLSCCSSLKELPASIGDATDLESMILNGCSSLKEIPSSIGNDDNLTHLDFSGCSSLKELPSSIGELHKLEYLSLKGCSKLEVFPIIINLESLDKLDLSDCSMLKTFPEISRNVRSLKLEGIAIEEIPSSWSHLKELHMSYSKNLGEFSDAFGYITELHLSDTKIQEIAPWIKELSRLKKLVLRGCTKLVSLPQLPDSLAFLDAENCASLERVDCSFHNMIIFNLKFENCFKLNQEARDLIIKTSTHCTILPGEKVPTYFKDRGIGSSVSMRLNAVATNCFTDLMLKACFCLVYKSDVEVGDLEKSGEATYHTVERLNGEDHSRGPIKKIYFQFPILKEHHICILDFKDRVTCNELVVEFEMDNKDWKISECGANYSINLEDTMKQYEEPIPMLSLIGNMHPEPCLYVRKKGNRLRPPNF